MVGIVKRIEELEKENAELKKKLKEKLKTIADKDLSFVAKFDALEKENAELKRNKKTVVHLAECLKEKQEEQLAQAKEIIKNCIHILKHSGTALDWKTVINQAEQFLKGENIILEDAQAGNSPFDADEVFNKEMKAYLEENVKKEIEK